MLRFVCFVLYFWGGRELIVALSLSTWEYNRIAENCQEVLEKIAGGGGVRLPAMDYPAVEGVGKLAIFVF